MLPEREYPMNNKKIIAMMMTLSMLAAAFAGCLGGDDEPDVVDPVDPPSEWTLTPAADVASVFVTSDWDPIIPNLNAGEMCDAILFRYDQDGCKRSCGRFHTRLLYK